MTSNANDWTNKVHFGDCRDQLRKMAAAGVKVQMCVTSPPYFGLRDYGVEAQIGLEATPEQFIAELVEVFRCVRDVLADDGTLWVNIGDSYAGSWGAQGRSGGNGDGKHAYNESISATQIEAAPRKLTRTGAIKVDGVKAKDLYGIPWMLAFALRADGWYLRQDIIWHKPNPMPESVTDRCTKAHEHLFLLAKSSSYFYDAEAVREPAAESSIARWAQDVESQAGSDRVPGKTNGAMKAVGGARRNSFARTTKDSAGTHGQKPQFRVDRDLVAYSAETRNRRSVWTIATRPYKGAHFATFPPALVEPCILAGSRQGDVVLDCFMGSGTTAAVAIEHGRSFIGCDLNIEYKPLQDARIADAHISLAAAQEAADLAARQIDLFAEAP
jgi:DNA modification methylase